MREELVAILARACADLIRELDPENGLLPRLLSNGVLTWEQVDRCRAKETPADKVQELISLLRHRPDSCFEGFCNVLVQVGRGDLIPAAPPAVVNENLPRDG
jgi:hypothetical protein